ncbi:cytochrome c oxidase subunit 5b-2, mitochondrial isoform X1 [Lactuca sativa]|uniref:Uncharacterized protein n=1 Tax=Lactuca sativa TaxID=4236 RepID=A0A9R1VU80_LACSA|nr:cytochrome c oxidase subunit 5b-2, mitochondrial isoform X1 [Lactuca sativa]KAJ0211368.1 hypothetical protein LSAT_V11C400198430 [Lactuca sativa]
MWRRLSSQLRILRSVQRSNAITTSSPLPLTLRPSSALVSRHISSVTGNVSNKRVEDIVPIATGHEREELQAEIEGRDILEINFPEGPFGTKEAPAVVKSYYDQRIVGCPGAEGEDEHDVVWFWLKKGEPHECPVCSQYFKLEVVGPGGLPDGLDEVDEHH